MGAESDQIKKHIEDKREELGAHLNELEHRVKSATDWRTHVRRRPGTAVAVAFGAGLVLALMS